jgi:hypothetical protein
VSIAVEFVRLLYQLNMLRLLQIAIGFAAVVNAHGDHDDQTPLLGPHKSLWYNTLPGDGGTQVRKRL